MNLAQAESIAKAVLYEGYMLYPYRPSSLKNRQRWTFGGVYPKSYSQGAGGGDPWSMQTECLVQGPLSAMLEVKLGFLHLIAREVGKLRQPLPDLPKQEEPPFQKLEVLEIDGRRFYSWQEAVEREVPIAALAIGDLIAAPRRLPFSFPGRRELEPLRSAAGAVVGVLARTQKPIQGMVELAATQLTETVFRITERISNLSSMESVKGLSREPASLYALVSTHAIFGLRAGEFVSLLDPPESLRAAATACENLGTYPVLVGVEGQRDMILSSPIILYDYPEIAPESPGDLFDGTEIDEILTLRILAMSDEEKREMAAVDERARALLERTEALAPEQLNKLHGALRSLRPAAASDAIKAPWEELDSKLRLAYLRVNGRDLRIGDHVRLRPRGGADIMDLALAGKAATIESIERDFEDRVHVAVTVDEDPGQDLGIDRMPGHRFFFSPEEVEPLMSEGGRGP